MQKLLEMQHEDFVANQIIDFRGSLLNLLQLESLNLNSVVERQRGLPILLKTPEQSSALVLEEVC